MTLPPKRSRARIWTASGSASRSIFSIVLSIPWAISIALALIAPQAWAQQAPSAPEDGDLAITEAPEVADIPARSALAQFTTAIENREPIDQVTFVENDIRKIFFFSDLRGLTGTTVFHRWIYDGKMRASVEFDVEGPRWRVWSSKELEPEWVGDWTVEVVTEDGETLASETFSYTAADE